MAEETNFSQGEAEEVKYQERKRILFFGLPWTFTKYTISQDMITIDEGLLKVEENDCYMYKVQDVKLSATLPERIFGLGTIINALFLGYFVTFFYNLITSVIDAPDQMAMQVVTVFIGVIITSLGISMYQLPKQGVAPYDSISLIMTEKWPKIPYFWCRVSNDAISALVCWLAMRFLMVCILPFSNRSIFRYARLTKRAKL